MREGVKLFVFLFYWVSVMQAYARTDTECDSLVENANLKDNVTSTDLYPVCLNTEVSTYRLPKAVRPVRYRLDLRTRVGVPEEDSSEFNGTVELNLTVEETTNKIVVHSKDLVILRFNISKFGQKEELESVTMDVDLEKDFLIFKRTNGKYDPGMYTLMIDYIGRLQNGSRGFIRHSYTNNENKTVWYAITNFQPVDARTAFPCFDEPGLKAKFNISITHYKDFTAYSNTAKISTSAPDAAGMVTSRFEETPKMSTYLVAFLVSDFTSVRDNVGNISVVARKDAIGNASFALSMGKLIRIELDKYLGIPYSKYMKKMDQVAVNDETFTAMENWGLITYREKLLLIAEDTNQTARKRDIAYTISYEIAHQWFGNLVSPKWWRYLWLSEGISTFLGYYIVEQIQPEWRPMELFVVKSVFSYCLDKDTIINSALNNDAETPEQIRSSFNLIMYDKGAAVFRMMQHFLTKDIFQEGLKNYVNQKKEDSVDSDDLFQLIEEVVRRDSSPMTKIIPNDLTKIMDTWVNHPGYPLITLTRNYTDNTITLEQECFIASGINKTKENCSSVWYVPISYVTTMDLDFNETTAQIWLTNKSAKVDLKLKPQHWVMLNKQATGYYRVNYDEQNWLLIIEYLKSSKSSLESIHVLNRAQLFSDALALVEVGQLDFSIFVKLLTILEAETDPIVWTYAIKAIFGLLWKLHLTDYYASLEKYSDRLRRNFNHQIVESIERESGMYWSYDGGPYIIRIYFNHQNCSANNELRNVFRWIANKKVFSPLMPCCDYRNATDEEFNQILDQIPRDNASFDEPPPGKTLCLQNQEVLRLYLNLTYEDEVPQNSVTKNPSTGPSDDPEFDFIIQKFASLLANELNNPGDLMEYVEMATTTGDKLNKLRGLNVVDKDNPGQVQNLIMEALARAEERVSWLENNKQALIELTRELDEKS